MNNFADTQRRQMMRQKLERATAVAAGLNFKVQPSSNPVIPNSIANVTVNVENSGRDPIDGLECGASPATVQQSPPVIDGRRVNHATATRLAPGAKVTVTDRFQIPATAAINVPLSRHLYEPTGLGTALTTRCTYELSGKRVGIDLPIRVDVAPPIEIEAVSASPIVTVPAKDEKCGFHPVDFKLRLTNNQNDSVSGDVVLFPTIGPLTGRGSATRKVELRAREKTDELFNLDGCELSKSQGGVSFIFHTTQLKTSPALLVRIVVANAKLAPNLRVAYIRGFDFSLPQALNALGVESKELSV